MFKHRRCLYWFEFAPIIKRAQRGGVSLRIAPPNHLNIVTILDGNKPARDGFISTGYSQDDWMRDAMLCNSSWWNGCIPMRGDAGSVVKNEAGEETVTMPVRGVRGTLLQLLNEEVISITPEVKALLRCLW